MNLKICLGMILTCACSAATAEPRKMSVPKSVAGGMKSFEPSGGTYLKDLGQFLIVSDDTDKEKSALLFLLGKDGKVSEEVLRISGLEKMADMESVSQDDAGLLYIMTSQGLNKKGKDQSERNLLVRATRQGKKIVAKDILQFRPLLLKALEESPLAPLKEMRPRLRDELDVESHFIKDGSLYIGLKNPQPKPGTALILNVGSLDRLFREKTLPASQVQILRAVDFKAVSNETDLLSEVVQLKEGLWMATTTEGGASRFWKIDPKTDKPVLKKTYTKERLEGLAYEAEAKRLLLLFDQGKHEAVFDFEGI